MRPGSARVVLHADDLGLNRAVTGGILRGFEEGLLTSASLLSNAPDAARAVDCWKRLDERRASGDLPSGEARRRLEDPPLRFDLGIHLNLTQGRPLSGDRCPRELLDAEGRFPGPASLLWRLVRHAGRIAAGLKEELSAQVQFLLDRGLRPTHLNGHQYVEMMPVVAELIPELLRELEIKVVRVAREPHLWRSIAYDRFAIGRLLVGHVKQAFARRFQRRMEAAGVASAQAFFGTVHAGRIDLATMRVFLTNAAPLRIVEIGMHPAELAEAAGSRSADGWDDPLAAARPAELDLLLSRDLREDLESRGFRLSRLAELTAD